MPSRTYAEVYEYGGGVLGLCQKVHGSISRLEENDIVWLIEARQILRRVRENWCASTPRTLRFDNLVLSMVEVAIDEAGEAITEIQKSQLDAIKPKSTLSRFRRYMSGL
jgi:hypothetical protein